MKVSTRTLHQVASPTGRRVRSLLFGLLATVSVCAVVVPGAVAGAAPTTTSSDAASSAASGDPTTATIPATTSTTLTTAVAGGTKTSTTTAGREKGRLHSDDPVSGSSLRPLTGSSLNGAGSSFAAPAIETWQKDVQSAPYSLNINYSSTSSGDGRYEFTNQTTDFAVSDIGYVGNTDTTPPSFPFIFVPITAGGIAFMYNIPGLTKNLQLTSYTACAILTGGITNWDNSQIATENPGANLPNLKVTPITESDSAGTNYVLEEWCIDEQPALWAAFAHQETTQSGGPTDGVAIAATSPNSNWPGIQGGLDDQTTTAVAGDVATNPGGFGAVQLQYATDENFGTGNTAQGVAAVQNASGDYTQPKPVNVASALAYATQNNNGTHVLNFNGVGPNVYNPSTYSYLLTPTKGWSTSKGATMSAFVNYVLTLGQGKANTFGYASLGLSLEQYGIDAVTADVPGAVATTPAEKAAFACGDLTPTEVAAGKTTATCGVTNAVAPTPPDDGGVATGAATTGSGASVTASASKSAAVVGATGTSGSSGSGSGSGSGGSGVDPAVGLSGTSAMAFTGGNPVPLTILGAALILVGWFGRRRVLRRRVQETP
jgi:ABC-type phosphate transport system substrate-binding protein